MLLISFIYLATTWVVSRREVKRVFMKPILVSSRRAASLPVLQPETPITIQKYTMIPRRYKTYNMTINDLQYEPNGIFFNWGTKPEANIKTPLGTRQRFHLDPQILEDHGYKRVWDTVQERTDPSVKGGIFRKWSKDAAGRPATKI